MLKRKDLIMKKPEQLAEILMEYSKDKKGEIADLTYSAAIQIRVLNERNNEKADKLYKLDSEMDEQVTLIEPKPVYKTTGAKRTGCVFCLFGISHDTDKFLRLKELEPKKYDYVMNGGHFENGLWMPDKNGLGYKFVIDWLNGNYPSGNLNIRY